ncbi:hypothetical protein PHYSODRAFT_333854 [Phytophthora sojae]|uniref:Uncharacterized protein n=1 Tax=Phytophthora sojae (strain P6497) TaxID=1094619 RepID=G4ZLZ7_PHYSP|nr:hypothetical protein PHYSODRAFT_333854 [Phytophthora sojae]EGZ15626.1 hypothetical protein PHYSODRAFT_333854 [Phytophthora sojae]|eukprot:XP_009529375.1 hypothetical protein PHYSODRAFT_333854 [Phytophthora sojae]
MSLQGRVTRYTVLEKQYSNGEILSISERQMHILERAATANMNVMTPALVASMELHCRDFVTKAANNEDMVYGM